MSVFSIWGSYSRKTLKYEGKSNMVMVRGIWNVIFVQNSLARKLDLINIYNMSMDIDHLCEGCGTKSTGGGSIAGPLQEFFEFLWHTIAL